MRSFLNIALTAAELSGNLTKEFYNKVNNVKNKGKNYRDLVSKVDIVNETTILKTIKSKFKNHNFLGEELGYENNNSKYTWIIDPLDGTVNYTRGISICAISISLKLEKTTILGVVYNPFLNELYYSTKNNTAYLNGSTIKVSKNNMLKNCLMISALSSESNKNVSKNFAAFRKLNNNSLGVLRLGSAAYGLALLARGSIDVFWGSGLKTWDIDAGLFLAKQAGAVIYEKKKSSNVKVIACNNKAIYKKIKKIVQY